MLILGVLALLAFPVAAHLAANAQPIAPVTMPALPLLPAHARAGAVRNLPVFVTLPSSQASAIVAAGPTAEAREVRTLATSLFGARLGLALVRAAEHGSVPLTVNAAVVRLPRLPPSALERENDLAALLIVAGAIREPGGTSRGPFGTSRGPFGDAGPVALTLLNAAAAGGACAPLLNRGFLLSVNSLATNSDVDQRTQVLVRRAYYRAAAACPGDPTPLWALTEYQSIERNTGATLPVLQRRFPRAPATWSAAGDAEIRYGSVAQGAFTARRWYELALASYRRAAALGLGAAAWTGEARALALLDQFGAAVRAQRRAVATDPASAELETRLLEYVEQDRAFGAAAQIAARITSVHRFASGPALFALPPDAAQESAEVDDVNGALSIGVGTMEPVELAVWGTNAGQAPTTVESLPFIPPFRPMAGIGGAVRWCPQWSRLEDLLLSGRPAEVLREDGGRMVDLRPGASDCGSGNSVAGVVTPANLAGIADLELGRVPAARAAARRSGMRLSALEDLRQNLWRYAGDYARAAVATAQWDHTIPDDNTAIVRVGEVAFLRGRYNDAALDFGVVADRHRWGGDRTDEAQALVDEGTALAYAGRHTEALVTLAAASDAAFAADPTGQGEGLSTSSAAQEQAGDMELDLGHSQQASDYYALAATETAAFTGNGQATPASPALADLSGQALDNNWAIAEIASGHPATAAQLAAQAIDQDRGDAIFWWTEADAQRLAGHSTTALADYRAALARDATEFPVANNIGVLLMRRGDDAAAVTAFRHAVGADPDYATGWFNLGVALSRLGPSHVFAAQGSLARADALKPALSSRAPVPIADNAVYISHLDLSRPLPPRWTFASSQNRSPLAAAGLSAILLLVISTARALTGRMSDVVKPEQWLPLVARLSKYAPRSRWLLSPALGILATVGFLLWPLHSGPNGGTNSVVVFVIGILILCAVVIRLRQIAAARAGLHLANETWLPSVCVGAALTALGLAWAPLPVVRAKGKAVGVHWVGPTAVAALAIALLLLATWLNVPLTRSLGAAALVMAASLLAPVKPLDGATVSATPAGALPGFAVLGAAVLMVAGVL